MDENAKFKTLDLLSREGNRKPIGYILLSSLYKCIKTIVSLKYLLNDGLTRICSSGAPSLL